MHRSPSRDSSLSKRLSRLVSETRGGPPSTPSPTVMNNRGHAMSTPDKNSPFLPVPLHQGTGD